MIVAIVILAFVVFGLMALAGFIDLEKLNNIVAIDKCDDCGKTKPLYYGPYDNLICSKCITEFSKEQSERDKPVTCAMGRVWNVEEEREV